VAPAVAEARHAAARSGRRRRRPAGRARRGPPGLRVRKGRGARAGVVLALAVVAEWIARRRVRAWRYAEREDDLLVQRGLLFSRLSVVPYGRMQFIDVTAGPFERSFGLATVRMHTAAAASDARIPGSVPQRLRGCGTASPSSARRRRQGCDGSRRLAPARARVAGRPRRRAAIAIAVLLVPTALSGGGDPRKDLPQLAVVGVLLLLGFVSWLVTRWRIDGDDLRIETACCGGSRSGSRLRRFRRSTSCGRARADVRRRGVAAAHGRLDGWDGATRVSS